MEEKQWRKELVVCNAPLILKMHQIWKISALYYIIKGNYKAKFKKNKFK